MRCSICKTENSDDLKFCNECGAALKRVCMRCSFENAAAAKFCGQCAADLGGVSSPSIPSIDRTATARILDSAAGVLTIDGERKMITALFADIKGSTELMANLDPEDARAIVDPALRIMVDAVRRYEGYVVHSTGDGIYALFGAPAACEDHAQRGIHAALEMQKKLQEHADRLATTGKPAIEVRVGINSGEVVVRSLETGGKLEYGTIGHTANLASRLQTAALAGSIAVSEHTRRLVEGYFELRALGPMAVKGISHPIDVYEVIGVGPLRNQFQLSMRRGLSTFVGRESELQRMRRALEVTISGQGQIVAAVTEAGTGKSRLLFEFNRTLPLECRLLQAYSVSYDKATAWLPVIELLRSYFGIANSDDATARRGKISTSLTALDPTLGDMLPYLFGLFGIIEGPDPLSMMDPQVKRQRTLDAIQRIILAESFKQPMVVMFEDLHWIDEQTQALLDLLAESIGSARVLLLVSYRPGYRHAWGTKNHYVELRLDPLTSEDAEYLLSALLADAVELRPLKRLIIERTGGSPFFIEEMVQALFDEGALVRNGAVKLTKRLGQLRIPPTVQGVLAGRIDRLSATQKELLQILAVIGRKLLAGVIREVASGIKALDLTLTELHAAGFIYEQPGLSQSDYIFKHALTQEVAYNSLLIERRKLLHERVGHALESTFDEKLGDHLSQLAHHYARSDNVAKAVEYLGRAGQQAIQRAAHADAVDSLNAAIRLVETLPDSPERTRQELPLRMALGVSLQTSNGYASSDAGEAYGRALELSERIGDPLQLVSVLRGQSVGCNVRADYKTALSLAQRLLAIGEGNHEYLIEGLLMSGLVWLYLGDLLSAKTHFVQGLALEYQARPMETFQYAGHSRAMCLSYLARTLWLLGYPDRALERSNEALSLAETLSIPITLAQAQGMHGLLYCARREMTFAEEWADKTISYATAQGLPYWLTLCSILKGWLMDQRGQSELGIHQFDQGLCGYRATGAKLGLSWILASRGQLFAANGRIGEGLLFIEEALSHIEDTGERYCEAEVRRLRGELLLRQSHPEATTAAETCFQQSLNVARGQWAKSWELRTSMSLARLRLRQGRFRDGVKLLGPIYDWFVEGFDTLDLKDARRLLDNLVASTQ
jgi:class 3 adenylate cyclase/predicted ATPase